MLNLISTGAQVQGKGGTVEGEITGQQDSKGFIPEPQNEGLGKEIRLRKKCIFSVIGQFMLNCQEVRTWSISGQQEVASRY